MRFFICFFRLYFIEGTKSDLSRNANVINVTEGERLQRKINAYRFLECSAKNNDNINEVIYEAVRATAIGYIDPPEPSRYRKWWNSARTSRSYRFVIENVPSKCRNQ